MLLDVVPSCLFPFQKNVYLYQNSFETFQCQHYFLLAEVHVPKLHKRFRVLDLTRQNIAKKILDFNNLVMKTKKLIFKIFLIYQCLYISLMNYNRSNK